MARKRTVDPLENSSDGPTRVEWTSARSSPESSAAVTNQRAAKGNKRHFAPVKSGRFNL
jgi:hypothetical protein